ncbi:MAG: class F sortase [Candidatus Saccharibacteria bacterium]|nr:class F sortase [Candidatus Saccharibacteria bacterium]
MTLKIDFSWRRCVKWVAWGLLGLLLLIFIIRVISFENYYYDAKDGSERAVTENVASIEVVQEELVEEEPTETEVREYTVPADRPRYLTIDRLGIYNARILPMGLTDEGALDTPRNIFDVGWYELSGKPGQGGTMLIDGHNGGPHVRGVFKNLPNLAEGDIIEVERGDGIVYKYRVVENIEVLLSEADAYMAQAAKSPVVGKESVSLISCTGEWSQQRGTYLSRQFTRAVLIED